MLELLTTAVQPWADLYADSPRLATVVVAMHVASMFVGGGMAIAADRRVMLATPGTADAVRAVIADLATTHSVVIGALVITITSGVALFASDVPTFAVSAVFLAKMAAIAALLTNGWFMRRTEGAALRSIEGAPVHTAEMPVPFPLHAWRGLRRSAGASLTLWTLLVLLGVLLTNG